VVKSEAGEVMADLTHTAFGTPQCFRDAQMQVNLQAVCYFWYLDFFHISSFDPSMYSMNVPADRSKVNSSSEWTGLESIETLSVPFTGKTQDLGYENSLATSICF
jgi:hypothetical protein